MYIYIEREREICTHNRIDYNISSIICQNQKMFHQNLQAPPAQRGSWWSRKTPWQKPQDWVLQPWHLIQTPKKNQDPNQPTQRMWSKNDLLGEDVLKKYVQPSLRPWSLWKVLSFWLASDNKEPTPAMVITCTPKGCPKPSTSVVSQTIPTYSYNKSHLICLSFQMLFYMLPWSSSPSLWIHVWNLLLSAPHLSHDLADIKMEVSQSIWKINVIIKNRVTLCPECCHFHQTNLAVPHWRSNKSAHILSQILPEAIGPWAGDKDHMGSILSGRRLISPMWKQCHSKRIPSKQNVNLLNAWGMIHQQADQKILKTCWHWHHHNPTNWAKKIPAE